MPDFFKRLWPRFATTPKISAAKSEPIKTPQTFPSTLVLGHTVDDSRIHKASFFGDDTVFGYDLVIWGARCFYAHDGHMNIISDTDLDRTRFRIGYRSGQFLDLLRRGKAIVIFPSVEHELVSFQQGFQATKNEWNEFYEACKTAHLSLKVLSEKGRRFEAMHDPFRRFLENANIDFRHYVRIESADKFLPGIRIPGSDKIVGGAFHTKDGKGIALFLPEPADGVICRDFVRTVWQLVQDLRANWPIKEAGEPPPAWVDDYPLPGEEGLITKINATNAEILGLKETLDNLEAQLFERQKDKRLIYAFDDDLEEAVENTMKEFDFDVEEQPNTNRTDRVFWYRDRAIVMEIKGRDNRGAEGGHLGQVNRWKGDFYEQHNRRPEAAILLVNGFRKLPLEDRTGKVVFEHNIVSDAKRDGIGLITGVQLLALKIAVETEELDKEAAREQLLGCVGLFEGFDTIEKISAKQEDIATQKTPG